MSITAQFAPYRLREGSWASAKERLVSAILDRLSEYAPNVKGSVLHQSLWTPEDYERELGLPEGSWHQGEMALDQMFFMRPVPGWSRYETPIEGLYLAGAATHPGGGITGACGLNAAQRAHKGPRLNTFADIDKMLVYLRRWSFPPEALSIDAVLVVAGPRPLLAERSSRFTN